MKNIQLSSQIEYSQQYSLLKTGIYTYFLLLIFEGALRKWFLPGLSAPLLIIRDPLAIWIIVLAFKKNILSESPYLITMVVIAVIGIVTSLIFGHGNLAVVIFGARILLLHFPLIFIMGNILDRNDVLKIGELTLWLSIPMIIIITLQFFSPQSAWINRGVGGDLDGAGFSGALGYFRPPGTFSFTNGNTLFFGFLSSFIFYYWFSKAKINRYLLFFATIALIASIPLSISRGLFFTVGVSLFFGLIAILFYNSQSTTKIIFSIISIGLLLILLGQTPLLETPMKAFLSRFDAASNIEGGLEGTLVDRYLGDLIRPFSVDPNFPFWGYGMGMGTNVGSVLLTGERNFLIAEGEWGRLIGEMGLLLGTAAIFVRLFLCLKMTLQSYKLLKKGIMLPWFILSFGLLNIPQGQWAQPTALGFAIISGGLILASFNEPRIEDKELLQK